MKTRIRNSHKHFKGTQVYVHSWTKKRGKIIIEEKKIWCHSARIKWILMSNFYFSDWLHYIIIYSFKWPRYNGKPLDENTKNRIAGLRLTKMTYKQILDLSKKENVITSLSAVKRIGLSYEIKGSSVSRSLHSIILSIILAHFFCS